MKETVPPSPPRRRLVFPVLLAFFVVLYAVNFRAVLVGDSLAHLYIAGSLVHSGDFDLREYEPELRASAGGELPYYVVEDRGRIRTIFNFMPGVVLAPVVAITEAALGVGSFAWGVAGKFAASMFTLLSGALLWLLLTRRAGERAAAWTVAAFWFATPLWPLSMTYLQHQPLIALKLAAMLLLFGREGSGPQRPAWMLALGGLAVGGFVLMRYQTVLTALPICAVAAWVHRGGGRFAWIALGGVPPLAALLLYNWIHVGTPFSTGYVVYPWAVFEAPFFATLAGLFVNPSKGLLLHSPWLALGAIAATAAWRGHREGVRVDALLLAAMVAPWPLVFLYAKYTGWFGGWSWGYRFLLDVLPELAIAAAFGIAKLHARRLGAWIAGALVACGVLVQSVGALAYDTSWHATHDLGTMPHQRWLWQVRDGQLAYYARRGRVYIFARGHQLREDPYAAVGLHPEEQWGGQRVAWTHAEGARFLLAARTEPAIVRVFPAPGANGTQQDTVTIELLGQRVGPVPLAKGAWTEVELPMLSAVRAAMVRVIPSRGWTEPGPGGRSLGVALRVD